MYKRMWERMCRIMTADSVLTEIVTFFPVLWSKRDTVAGFTDGCCLCIAFYLFLHSSSSHSHSLPVRKLLWNAPFIKCRVAKSNDNEVMGDACLSFHCLSQHFPLSIFLLPLPLHTSHCLCNGVNLCVLNSVQTYRIKLVSLKLNTALTKNDNRI